MTRHLYTRSDTDWAVEAVGLGLLHDPDGQASGMVPLSYIRKALKYVIPDRERQDKALLQAERAGKIQLITAESPSKLAHRAACIDRPGRGVIAWAGLK